MEADYKLMANALGYSLSREHVWTSCW